jgi:hypothetical protein
MYIQRSGSKITLTEIYFWWEKRSGIKREGNAAGTGGTRAK